MRFCSECGSASIKQRIPFGDNRKRYICGACDAVFYHNPKIIAGCILEWENKVLLCKRSIEPKSGLWTVPAGFMENGESVKNSAIREAKEEAQVQAEGLHLYCIYTLKYNDQVYIIFRGCAKDGQAQPGEETSQIHFYDEEEIVWDDIAFPVVQHNLRLYFEDRKQGYFGLHCGVICRDANGVLQIAEEVNQS